VFAFEAVFEHVFNVDLIVELLKYMICFKHETRILIAVL